MSQYLESYGLDRKRTAVYPFAANIVETRPLNKIWSLSFELPATEEKIRYLGQRRLVRYQDGELYRILDQETNEEDISVMTFACEHVLAMLADKIMEGDVSIENKPTADVIRAILAYQKDWTLAECDFGYLYGYAWTDETLLNALWSVTSCFPPGVAYKWVTDTSVYPYRLSLKRIDLTGRPNCMMIQRLNEIGVRKPSKSSTIVNRLYPKGKGEGVNQTNIRKVNNGKSYIEDKESIQKYGLVERNYIDKSIEDPKMLLDVSKAYLAEACKPLVEYEVTAAEVYSITGNRMYRPEPGDVILLKEDGYKSFVTEVEQKHDEAGSLSLTIANRTEDLADMLEDMANKARIESTYAQGSTILWGAPMAMNADNKNPMKYPLWMPKSIIHANVIHMKIELSRFRTDSKGIKSGGGTAKTTSASGGTTVTSANGGEMDTQSMTTKAYTGASVDENDVYMSNTEYAEVKMDEAGTHYHESTPHSHSFSSVLHWGHRHSTDDEFVPGDDTGGVVNYQSKTISGETGGTKAAIAKAGSHTHGGTSHKHWMRHFHNVVVYFTIPSRPGHMHKVTIGKHTHSVDIPDHVHEQEYGIYMASETPESASVKINGVEAFVMGKTWEGEITQWMVDSSGNIPRGKFVDIEVKPNINAFVTIAVAAQAFISGKEGGQY